MPRLVHKVPKASTAEDWIEGLEPDKRPLVTSLLEAVELNVKDGD